MPQPKLLTCLLAAALAACSLTLTVGEALAAAPAATLASYRDQQALDAALERWRERAQAMNPARARSQAAGGMVLNMAPQAAPAASAPSVASAEKKMSAEAAAAADSITNVQTAGVDEGGLVKRAGDHLLILRRGRLFTVRVGGDSLQPVAAVDAYAPGSDPRGAWYDELLVSGDTAVVIGYSYARGGTEIGLFDIGRNGSLAHRATHHLRSFDYYSTRNYASRLIGSKLVFYSPTLLQPWGPPLAEMQPGHRPWRGANTPAAFQKILPATRVYRTDDDFDPARPLALHTVTSCDLATAQMRCESTAVLGPAGRVFYVSQGSVYVWTAGTRAPVATPQPLPGMPGEPMVRLPQPASASAVFRIPLDGAAPSALKTTGVPIDQMSFLEGSDGTLNVLLREAGRGEGMWGSERTSGGMALLRVPLAAFGDGRGAAQREHYRRLPDAMGGSVQNRFVGDWLVWSAVANARGRSAGEAPRAGAWALRYADAGSVAQPLDAGHGVERIEALGNDALLVGSAGRDLAFTAVRLGRSDATLAGRHLQPDAAQGETRTHGFFFRATGADGGLLGLPVTGPDAGRRSGGAAIYGGGHGSAGVLFLRARELQFTALGALDARPAANRDDGCKASCVDWYGNARPIFLGDRVFALLGYELVEGRLAGAAADERIDERRRTSFAPAGVVRDGRFSPFE